MKGSKVTLLPPHLVHDGRPAASAGYLKRVLYVGTDPGDAFEAESMFALVAARLSEHLGELREDLHPDGSPVAEDLRDLLDARARLLEGQPLAQVAADVGFHHQAHFAKHFKRHVRTTPGSYRGGGHRCGS